MKNILKKMMVLSLVVMMSMPSISKAVGTTSIDITNKAPKVGDQFTVTINASESGEMNISYNAAVIEFVSSSVDSTSTSSHSIKLNGKSAKVTFKAKAEGSSGVIVESPSLTGSSITVPVAGGGNTTEESTTTQEQSSPSPSPATEESAETTTEDTNVPATDTTVTTTDQAPVTTNAVDGADFVVDGIGYVVSERYKKEEIPEGFSVTNIEINGKKVKELTNGVITLVYLKPMDNTDGPGEFYLLNTETNEAVKLYILGDSTNYIFVKEPVDFFSEYLVETELNFNEKTYKAYQIQDSQSEFYYLYGSNAQGAEGWFAFDSLSGTVSRADVMSINAIANLVPAQTAEPGADEVTEPEKEKNKFSISPKVLLIVAAVLVLLLIILGIINLIIHRKDDDYYDDYDDELESNTYENKSTTIKERPEVVSENKSGSIMDSDSELIDQLIKKASNNNNQMDIMDLDDL